MDLAYYKSIARMENKAKDIWLNSYQPLKAEINTYLAETNKTAQIFNARGGFKKKKKKNSSDFLSLKASSSSNNKKNNNRDTLPSE